MIPHVVQLGCFCHGDSVKPLSSLLSTLAESQIKLATHMPLSNLMESSRCSYTNNLSFFFFASDQTDPHYKPAPFSQLPHMQSVSHSQRALFPSFHPRTL